jgi:hypothetical protein
VRGRALLSAPMCRCTWRRTGKRRSADQASKERRRRSIPRQRERSDDVQLIPLQFRCGSAARSPAIPLPAGPAEMVPKSLETQNISQGREAIFPLSRANFPACREFTRPGGSRLPSTRCRPVFGKAHRLITRQMRSGVAGPARLTAPKGASASVIALTTAGKAPTAPASPQPLTPSGLVVQRVPLKLRS